MDIKTPCKIGDTIGYIQKYLRDEKPYVLVEAKVSSIRLTKEGLKVYAPKKFRPLYADDIELNTEIMSGDSLILVKEPFVLNDFTRARAERWIAAVNENPELARGLLE